MCNEIASDSKPSKAVLWTQQNKQSQGKHIGHAKKEQCSCMEQPELSSQLLAEELGYSEGNKRQL